MIVHAAKVEMAPSGAWETRARSDGLPFALPDGTGADLLRRSPTARPKVCILLTGFHADDVDTTGFDVVLKKPIPATDLLEVIRARM
jgi:hypothetical protein